MSLRSRLFGAIGLTLCLLLVAVMLVAVPQAQRTLDLAKIARQRMVDNLDLASAMVAGTAPEYHRQWGLVGRDGSLDARLTGVVVFDVEGGSTLSLRESFGTEPDDTALNQRATALATRLLEGIRVELRDANTVERQFQGRALFRDNAVARAYHPTVGARDGGVAAIYYLEAPDPESDLPDPFELGRKMYVVIVVGALVLLALTWVIVDRVVVRPLNQVVKAAARIAEGDYSVPVPPARADDEIQKVITAFNAMMVELDQMQGQLKERIGEAVRDARKTQDSLVIAQRLAATGRLAAGIAHEVNNPLAGMLNAVRSLRTKEMKPARREEYLGLIEEGLQRIERTVAKILQFTPHKVDPRALTLAEVVRPVMALSRHRIERDGVEATVELPEDVRIFGDLYELQQALLNVILNALDAMADVADRPSKLFVRGRVDGEYAVILVRDNGTGIRPEDEDRVFDLFFTTKETGKGSGMGLATVHKIVTDHGGRVELRSRGADGADLLLYLPLLS